MTIYIDTNYKCHVADPGNMMAVETDVFDGKCAEYIEGYRFVPSGYTWTREDGETFTGEMTAPWKDWNELDAAQAKYEREQYQAMAAQLAAMDEEYQKGVNSL